jgi:hypothetical protein
MVALMTCGHMLFGRETVLGLSLIKPACLWTGGGRNSPSLGACDLTGTTMRSQSVAAKKQKTSKKAIHDFSSHGEDFSKASCQCDFIVVSDFCQVQQ